MKAVILAAGRGTRMMPLTSEKPKPLIEVLDKPVLVHLFEALPDEVDEIILVIGYRGDQIRDYFGDEFEGRKIHYVVQEELAGHIPAIELARPYLNEGERFLVSFADDIHEKESIARLAERPLGVLVYETDMPERFGIAVTDAEGRITEIEEKPENPKSNLAVTGVYMFDTSLFDYEAEPHPKNGEYYLPPVIHKMAQEKEVWTEREGLWVPLGYPEDIKRAEKIIGSAD